MTSYNHLPFQGRAHRETHPRRLAAHARLYGVSAPSTQRCRVLELGCASGDNLIAMAVTMPDATFVGIDISDKQIEAGRAMVSGLGLTNVRLEHLGILEVTPEFGEFDYIIAHGVYSWVPAPVRDKTLEIFEANLSESGVAYLCYNTYPGWHFRETVRNFLRAHVPRGVPESEAAALARSLLERFEKNGVPDDLFAKALAREAALFRDLPDSYLYHELLETDNFALYFKEFLEKAGQKGLVYVTDTEPFTALLDNLDKATADWICDQADTREDVEQSLDYVYARTIRHPLLTRGHKTIHSWPDAHAVHPLFVAGNPRPDKQPPPLSEDVTVRFSSSNGKSLGVRSPVSKVALSLVAGAWPVVLSFSNLLEQTVAVLRDRVAGEVVVSEVREVLEQTILAGHACGLLDLLDTPVPVAPRGVETPRASPLCRYQASMGRSFVTNLHHEEIALTGVERRLLGLLDGRLDRGALVHAMKRGHDGSFSVREFERMIARFERAALFVL